MAEQIGHLHGCRLAREGQQPVAAGMAGEINQHVDAILADHLCDRCVAETHRAAPMIGEAAEPTGDGIGHGDFGITEQLDRRVIMRRKQRLGEQRNGMLAEIG